MTKAGRDEQNLEISGLPDNHPNVSLFDWFKECARHSVYANPKSAKKELMPLVEKKIVQTDQTGTFVYTTVLFHKYGILSATLKIT